MRLLPRTSDSSDYQGGLFNEQELVWLNLCSRVQVRTIRHFAGSSGSDPVITPVNNGAINPAMDPNPLLNP